MLFLSTETGEVSWRDVRGKRGSARYFKLTSQATAGEIPDLAPSIQGPPLRQVTM